MMELNIKHLSDLNRELSIAFKKAASYTNKKYMNIKCVFKYSFLIADNYIILYFNSDMVGNISTMAEKIEIQDCYDNAVIHNLFPNIIIGKEKYHLYLVPSLLPSKNDILFEILANSYNILIPTSLGNGMNLMDTNRNTNLLYEISEFMKENMVWWWRRDDGPNNCGNQEDDCTMMQYISSIIKYI